MPCCCFWSRLSVGGDLPTAYLIVPRSCDQVICSGAKLQAGYAVCWWLRDFDVVVWIWSASSSTGSITACETSSKGGHHVITSRDAMQSLSKADFGEPRLASEKRGARKLTLR